ncbi:hypothetical protein [Vibrio algivorus]|uniref:Entericidin A/B family lipoprotein n=1 Tax=Vibrio algivorus TaxID=1667024 RepID=A0A557PBZ8_9VIBR|nr:hypothetical protein [Vibrio algivorus]TVO38184.1 hypothetical protein FOF44_04905 [Vibrio algivorus]
MKSTKSLTLLLSTMLLFAGCAQQEFKDNSRDAAQATKEAGKTIGHATRDAAKETGHFFRDIFKD